MWKWLYALASPRRFYELSGRWIPWLGLSAVGLFLLGTYWGLVLAPADYQQGDAFRIMYVHVPCAFLSMSLYACMGFMALLVLIWRIKLAGIVLMACAQTGAMMTLLALVTGSLWGKPMWGTWWVWDARLTSELILLFLYGAIWAVGQAYQYQVHSDRIVAILALVGLVDLPIIHYSVYWWNSLHQGGTFLTLSKPKIAASMAYPLMMTLSAFLLYSAMLVLLKTRHALLLREHRQSWVVDVI